MSPEKITQEARDGAEESSSRCIFKGEEKRLQASEKKEEQEKIETENVSGATINIFDSLLILSPLYVKANK